MRVWYGTERDSGCENKNIPRHLHTCAKPAIQKFCRNERLFRRFPPGHIQKLQNTVKLEGPDTSSNRSLFSNPDDVRRVEETGAYQAEHGVVSFPVRALHQIRWDSDNGKTVVIRVLHDPLRCNYSHCDFEFWEDDQIVEKIVGSAKVQIRDMLKEVVGREC